MILPTININGTSAETLLDQYRKALLALDLAAKAIAETAPHGRDYQGAQPGDYATARKEHEVRARSIEALRQDYETLGLHAINRLK